MERRFLDRIYDHNNRRGAYATTWEGWVSVNRIVVDTQGRINRFPAFEEELDEKVGNFMGVYAILHETDSRTYALYIGYSKILHDEIKKRLREMSLLDDDTTSVTVLYIPNKKQATHYEDELIRYYAPPWNTRFYKQG